MWRRRSFDGWRRRRSMGTRRRVSATASALSFWSIRTPLAISIPNRPPEPVVVSPHPVDCSTDGACGSRGGHEAGRHWTKVLSVGNELETRLR